MIQLIPATLIAVAATYCIFVLFIWHLCQSKTWKKFHFFSMNQTKMLLKDEWVDVLVIYQNQSFHYSHSWNHHQSLNFGPHLLGTLWQTSYLVYHNSYYSAYLVAYMNVKKCGVVRYALMLRISKNSLVH